MSKGNYKTDLTLTGLLMEGPTLGGCQGEESDSMVRVPKLTLLRHKQKPHPAKHRLDGLPDHDLETI